MMKANRHTTVALLFGALLANLCCARSIHVSAKLSRHQPTRPRVAIVISEENSLLEEPMNVLLQQTDADITTYTLAAGDDASDLDHAMTALAPSLVITLGKRATLFAKPLSEKVPVLFMLVPNYQQHGLQAGGNMMGICLETPPVSDFMQFRIVVSKLHRVLVFFSESGFGTQIAQVKRELVDWGVDLVPVRVAKPDDVAKQYRTLAPNVDAVWLESDPVVMNNEAFTFLLDATTKDKLPFLTSLSDRFARVGALASVSVDMEAMASQAAVMANAVLSGEKRPSELGVQAPVGGRIAVNIDTAQTIGLSLSVDALSQVGELIGHTVNDGGHAANVGGEAR